MYNSTKILIKNEKPRWLPACLMLATALFLLASCNKEPFHAAQFSLIDDVRSAFIYTKSTLQIPPDGGVRMLTLVSNREWSIDYDQRPWLSISPTSGKGIAAIEMNISPNESLTQDTVYMYVTNNTLLVRDSVQIIRQNYLGTYNGSTSIASPITQISTSVPLGEEETKVNASLLLEASGQSTRITLRIQLRVTAIPPVYYTIELPTATSLQIVTVEGRPQFVFTGTGTYDATALASAYGYPALAGVKNTALRATLSNGRLVASIWIDPGAGNTVDPAKTTLFEFDGSK